MPSTIVPWKKSGIHPSDPGIYPRSICIKLDLCICTIPTVGLYGKLGEVTATHNRTSRMNCRTPSSSIITNRFPLSAARRRTPPPHAPPHAATANRCRTPHAACRTCPRQGQGAFARCGDMGGGSGVYLSDANVQGLVGGAYLCYLFLCGNSGGLSWSSVIEHRVFTSSMSS